MSEETVENLVPKKQNDNLLTYDQLPDWYKDNCYIKKYYRPVYKSYKKCINSLFQIHNETVNIWSHLLPGSLILSYFLYWIFIKERSEYLIDNFIMCNFYITIVYLYSGSVTFHIFLCHSEKVFNQYACIDYSGIIALMIGGFMTVVYFLFLCRPVLQLVYISANSICGITALYFMINPKFNTPKYRSLRGIIFIILGLSAVVPVFHMVYLNGLYFSLNNLYFGHLVIMGLTFIFGAILYILRFPEKYIGNGWFDLIGNSHNFHHLGAILGIVQLIGRCRHSLT